MKDIFVLTKVLLKNVFQKRNKNMDSKVKKFSTFFLYAIIYLYLAGLVGFISYQAINSLMEINQEAVIISILLLGISGFILFQTIFTSLNVLFFSKDIEYLLPLPINPIKIIIAKFNVLLISEYIMELILGVVPLTIYGYLTGASIMYYIVSLIILLVYPILPVLIASFLVILIMRFTNIIKNKDIVQYLTVALTMVLVIAIQVLSGSGEEITNTQLTEKLLEANGLVSVYSKYFITLEPTMNALLNYNTMEGLKNLFILLAQTTIFYTAVTYISSKLYLKTATKGFSGGSKKSKKIDNDKYYVENKILGSYVKKEFKILIRNPIFFMQCVLPSILFPLVITIPIVMQLNSAGQEELQNMVNGISSSLILAICIVIIQFFFMFNYVSITAVSRDGSNAVFMKYIPIPLHKQCKYKVMPSIILNFIPIIYTIIALKIVLPSISLSLIFYLFIISILLNILESYMMIIVDLKRPKLLWTTEYAVVKQNMNMIFEMFFGLIIIVVTILGGNTFKNENIFALTTILIVAIGIYITQKYIFKNENKLFKKIA